MRIRKATNRDGREIKRLIRLYPDKLLQTHLPKMAEFFVAVINDPPCATAKAKSGTRSPNGSGERGKIVGCCAFVVYSKRLAEIRSLSVEKDFQGRGIASMLIETCLKLAKKKKIYEVLAITAADGLFQRYGFATFNKEKFALLKFM